MKVSTAIQGRRYFYSKPEMNALSRTESRDPSAHDMTRFNFDAKSFFLHITSFFCWGSLADEAQLKWRKGRFVVGQDDRLKKRKNPDQQDVKFPAAERLNCSF